METPVVKSAQSSLARKSILSVALLALTIGLAVVVSGCTNATPATNWSSPNLNLENTRYAGGRIDSTTVDTLGVAWTADLKTSAAFGAVATTPLIIDGSVYIQDLKSNVYSYDLGSGQLNWEKKYDSETVGPNGLTFSNGNLFGATKTDAFALKAESGTEVWLTKNLADKNGAGFTIAPQVYDGKVQISTAAQVGGGIAYALDEKTGKEIWSWNSITPKTAVAGGKVLDGGAWNAPLIHDGSVFWGIGNPYQTIETGIKDPQKGLYINSLVKLGADDGKLDCYNQAVPNDFYDWDMQISPILTEGEDDQDIVLGAGKHGRVYAFDPDNCKQVWKTNVGKHNGHDNDSVDALNGDFKPKSPLEVYPGTLGGVETNMAVAHDNVYVTTVELPATYKDFSKGDVFEVLAPYATGKGQLTSLNVENGKVNWVKQLGSMPFGAATVANDVVFVTTYDGNIYGFDEGSGDQLWTSKLPAGTNSPIAISDDTIIVPAGIQTGKGQKTQLVAFRIGGVGQIGGAEAPKQEKAEAGKTAEKSEGASAGGGAEGASAGGGGAEAAIDAKAIFTQNCGGCHTLADAGTSGNVGPNLDDLKPDAAAAHKQIENGGGGMPAFKGTLSDAEIEALSEYIASVDGS
jgi:outer membrane protein assembly factor BamB/cytochrome c553